MTQKSFYKIKFNKNLTLSEQQLVDCSRDYGNFGCNGGFAYNGLRYIRDKGVTTEDKYPYK